MKQGFEITFSYDIDPETHTWNGQLRYREKRSGQFYGGAAVYNFKSKPTADFNNFMKQVRDKVKKDLNVFWT